MKEPKSCRECPAYAVCHAAYYGGTMCRYAQQIHRRVTERMRRHE